MNKVTFALALTCAGLIGCVASTFVVPQVRAGTNPTLWEYNCIKAVDEAEIHNAANKHGQAGWEMVASGTGFTQVWCFKRARP